MPKLNVLCVCVYVGFCRTLQPCAAGSPALSSPAPTPLSPTANAARTVAPVSVSTFQRATRSHGPVRAQETRMERAASYVELRKPTPENHCTELAL